MCPWPTVKKKKKADPALRGIEVFQGLSGPRDLDRRLARRRPRALHRLRALHSDLPDARPERRRITARSVPTEAPDEGALFYAML